MKVISKKKLVFIKSECVRHVIIIFACIVFQMNVMTHMDVEGKYDPSLLYHIIKCVVAVQYRLKLWQEKHPAGGLQ